MANIRLLSGQCGKEIWRTQHDVGEDLVIVHLHMANRNTQTENLLQLELDRGTNFHDLVVQVLRMRYGCGEFAGYSHIDT